MTAVVGGAVAPPGALELLRRRGVNTSGYTSPTSAAAYLSAIDRGTVAGGNQNRPRRPINAAISFPSDDCFSGSRPPIGFGPAGIPRGFVLSAPCRGEQWEESGERFVAGGPLSSSRNVRGICARIPAAPPPRRCQEPTDLARRFDSDLPKQRPEKLLATQTFSGSAACSWCAGVISARFHRITRLCSAQLTPIALLSISSRSARCLYVVYASE